MSLGDHDDYQMLSSTESLEVTTNEVEEDDEATTNGSRIEEKSSVPTLSVSQKDQSTSTTTSSTTEGVTIIPGVVSVGSEVSKGRAIDFKENNSVPVANEGRSSNYDDHHLSHFNFVTTEKTKSGDDLSDVSMDRDDMSSFGGHNGIPIDSKNIDCIHNGGTYRVSFLALFCFRGDGFVRLS